MMALLAMVAIRLVLYIDQAFAPEARHYNTSADDTSANQRSINGAFIHTTVIELLQFA
jgi:hypothetical protein